MWYTIFSFSIISAALLITLLGIWLTAILPLIDRRSKRFFISYFTALMACSLVSLADLIMNQYLGIALQRIFGFFEVLLLSVPLPMLTGYLVHCCKNDVKKNAVLRTTAVFWIVFFLLLCSTLFTEHIYIVQTPGQFQRGEWFALLLIPLNAITLLNLVCLIRYFDVMPNPVHSFICLKNTFFNFMPMPYKDGLAMLGVAGAELYGLSRLALLGCALVFVVSVLKERGTDVRGLLIAQTGLKGLVIRTAIICVMVALVLAAFPYSLTTDATFAYANF